MFFSGCKKGMYCVTTKGHEDLAHTWTYIHTHTYTYIHTKIDTYIHTYIREMNMTFTESKTSLTNG